ncbi:MAG: hypothetical protein COV60_00320 [Candidatus Magasanikbacteria bacterium CG11_big_fil_rev_8_21_14_0_20_43_7]|uniref:Addiction module toxin RelE n=1 Tax=Candidatus Magasanikbacteria bacterium CG11_big_fil_rev_8_21_14_0_20_43_7 TaxID=1974654 RepID=A0A2H0N3I6_9BACT|nr:MAG: hypothetical protein COV60_00320 [Candidatus Magasanikbacteria bacterium CG11_big_fil_rev_8_21_14_0_20_43_7]
MIQKEGAYTIKFFTKHLTAFILSLPAQTQGKTLRLIELLERHGYTLGIPYTKKVDRDLFELRIRGKLEIRIFYTFHTTTIVLLSGFVKKSQRIPKQEIMKAKKLLQLLDDT